MIGLFVCPHCGVERAEYDIGIHLSHECQAFKMLLDTIRDSIKSLGGENDNSGMLPES